MGRDLDAIVEKGFNIKKDLSNGANARVLLVEHENYGECILKYAHPEAILFTTSYGLVCPVPVGQKYIASIRNRNAYEGLSHLSNIPNLYDEFKLPEFWDAAIDALGLDPNNIEIPTEDSPAYPTSGDISYRLSHIWRLHHRIQPGSIMTVDEIKSLCNVPVIITQYIDGKSVSSEDKHEISQSSYDELKSTVEAIHSLCYAGVLPNGEVDRGNIMIDKKGKLWVVDFGCVGKAHVNAINSLGYKLACEGDLNELSKLDPLKENKETMH